MDETRVFCTTCDRWVSPALRIPNAESRWQRRVAHAIVFTIGAMHILFSAKHQAKDWEQ